MTKSSKSVLKNFGYLLSAHWVREVLQTIFIIALARQGTEMYGQFMLAISIGQLLLFASEFGLNQHLSTMLARKENYPSRILRQVTFIKVAFLFFGWLAMIGFTFWQDYSPQLRAIIIVVATAIGLEGIGNSFFVACQVLERQDVEGKSRGIASLFGYGYGLIALFSGFPATMVALFKILETFTNLGVVARLFFRRFWRSFRLESFTDVWGVWKEGLVYTAMAVCAIFYNKINMFFLQKYAGSEGVAQYSATWQIVDFVSVLVSSLLLGKVMFPLFTKLWVNDRTQFKRLAQKSSAWLVAAALPISYVLFVESDRIITLVYGQNYGPAIQMQKELVGCILFAFIHNLASYLMVSMKCQRILLVMYTVGLAANFILCMVLIPQNPMSGTAYAILLTKGGMAFMTVSFCQFAIGLFVAKDVLRLLVIVAAAVVVHLVTVQYFPRTVVEILTLCPLLYHAYRLYLRQQKTLPGALL
ncbi:lipopolysaccharide biosynthesis protein [Pseudodesulfovibrio methanolicus]|uniref:Oligosaccharide flippase family protein n=1 Tax=Pseudodesulfovibrio methanolicus TaxID=3126690 RepID=A0ABZ2ITM5_9BACT